MSGDAHDDAAGAVPSAPSDADLLRAHVDGDPGAFAELVRRHRDRLWAVALRTTGDREEAADAVQDALLSAHRAAARFRGDSQVTTWLHRIVVNACLDRLRKRQAHPTVPLPDGSHAGDGRHSGPEPAAPVQDHDTALVVREALAALPADQRAALVLVDVQGYPVAEAAEMLGVAEGTVKSRCSRGRARMAVALGHLRHGGEGHAPAGRRRGDQGHGPAGSRHGDEGHAPAGSPRGDEGHAPAGNHNAAGSVPSGSVTSGPAGATSEGRERR